METPKDTASTDTEMLSAAAERIAELEKALKDLTGDVVVTASSTIEMPDSFILADGGARIMIEKGGTDKDPSYGFRIQHFDVDAADIDHHRQLEPGHSLFEFLNWNAQVKKGAQQHITACAGRAVDKDIFHGCRLFDPVRTSVFR